jgi:hypothetical protein
MMGEGAKPPRIRPILLFPSADQPKSGDDPPRERANE